MPVPLFRTPVSLPPKSVAIAPNTGLLFVGSCFAAEVGERALSAGLKAVVNPAGTLYNMESILGALQRWSDSCNNCEDHIYEGADSLWHSCLHSSVCDGLSIEECVARSQEAERIGKSAFQKANVIFVTAGSNHLYCRKVDGCVVANCHKQPADEYVERIQSFEEIVSHWGAWLSTLPAEKRVVFTVSPYRYAKYGMHESRLSKAALLLAIDELCRQFVQCVYFPSYEIVLDELRDYRFYKADMLHVNSIATAYVWQRLSEWAFTPATHEFVRECQSLCKRVEHVPRRADSEQYSLFEQETERLIAAFETKWGIPFKR